MGSLYPCFIALLQRVSQRVRARVHTAQQHSNKHCNLLVYRSYSQACCARPACSCGTAVMLHKTTLQQCQHYQCYSSTQSICYYRTQQYFLMAVLLLLEVAHFSCSYWRAKELNTTQCSCLSAIVLLYED
eukprot:13096-Heterococcus_DN1.PRE.3